MSPGRTISPIDEDYVLDSPTSPRKSLSLQDDDLLEPISCNFVSFSEIDAQITPLKVKGLETIFENVFLETPPRGGGRSVIPRRKYDRNPGDSAEDDEDEGAAEDSEEEDVDVDHHQITPLVRGSLIYEEEETTMCSSSIQDHFGTTTTTTSVLQGRNDDPMSVVFCNSFQRRLNLIPGED